MKRSILVRRLTWLAWGLVIGDIFLFGLLPSQANLLGLLFSVCGLLGSLVAGTTWLMISHHRFFSTWPGWLLSVVLLATGNLLSGDTGRLENAWLVSLFAVLNLLSIWMVGLGTAILLWRRDEGLQILAVISAGMVLGTLIAWQIHGDLFEYFFALMGSSEQVASLWWLNTLVCIFWWSLPLGILSFVWHTGRIVLKEFQHN